MNLQKKIDDLIATEDDKIKMLEARISQIRQRIKFLRSMKPIAQKVEEDGS